MPKTPEDLLGFFFEQLKIVGKYEIDIQGNSAFITPRLDEQYYKPVIQIPNLEDFAEQLMEYMEAVYAFNEKNQVSLHEYQGLSYILNIMLFNMTSTDAWDLTRFIETRTDFFRDQYLDNYAVPTKVFTYNHTSFLMQRKVENFGLETPYIMTFSMDVNGELLELPIIRYAIDQKGVCFLYAVQIGRGHFCDIHNPNYKRIVNQVNQGAKKYRNTSPSFVLVLAMFLQILNQNHIHQIVIPDFLFNRYKQYYGAKSMHKSDVILSRMFHNMTILVNRLNHQIEGFHIQNYPLDQDSYYHIEIENLQSKNKMLQKLFTSE